MKNNFLLSVIVPVYNEKKTFFILTKKLLKLKIKKVKLEIIIVESNSTDGTRDEAHAKTFMDGDATVTQVSVTGADLHTYKFYGLWPTELAEVPLDWASDAIQEFTVTWAYDYWGHGASFSSPTSIVDASTG